MFRPSLELKNSAQHKWIKEGDFTWKFFYAYPGHHFKSVTYTNEKSKNQLTFTMTHDDYGADNFYDSHIKVKLIAEELSPRQLDQIAKLCAEKKSIPFRIEKNNESLSFHTKDPRIIATFLRIVNQFDPLSQKDLHGIFKTLALDYPVDDHLDMDSKDFKIHILQQENSLLHTKVKELEKNAPIVKQDEVRSHPEKRRRR